MSLSDVTMPTPLVDVDWLHAHLTASDIVIVDCRFALSDPQQGRRDYQSGHIPGAYYLDLNQDLSGPVQKHGGRHPLPKVGSLVSTLEALGISSRPSTRVVAYDATKNAFAARLWWLLRYLGHESVAVLDGGLPAWQATGYPLTTQMPAARSRGQFYPQLQTDWIVDRAAVLQCQTQAGAVLVDARSPERYRGEQEPIDPIAGSIPNAVNVFWQQNLDADGRYKPPAELEQVWTNIPAGNPAIYYCGSGVTACVNILAQAVIDKAWPQLYVGGWSDWCTYQLSQQDGL